MSKKHLGRYVQEFTGRHNIREHDTINPMQEVVAGMIGKRLMYSELWGIVMYCYSGAPLNDNANRTGSGIHFSIAWFPKGYDQDECNYNSDGQ